MQYQTQDPPAPPLPSSGQQDYSGGGYDPQQGIGAGFDHQGGGGGYQQQQSGGQEGYQGGQIPQGMGGYEQQSTGNSYVPHAANHYFLSRYFLTSTVQYLF